MKIYLKKKGKLEAKSEINEIAKALAMKKFDSNLVSNVILELEEFT